MNRRILICLLAGFLGLAVHTKAQVLFSFVPDVYARTVDGLSSALLLNNSGRNLSGQVNIKVSEMQSGRELLNILTPAANYTTGSNRISMQAFQRANFRFADNNLARLINQTRQIPPGTYRFCYDFIPADHTIQSMESCFESAVQPLVPITLIQPADRDSICNKRPLLTWQPPLPLHPGMRYRLLLTEKVFGKGAEVLLQAAPLLLLDQISGNSIVYPSNYPELKEGHTYYWQVGAYMEGLLVSTSETWEFTVQCTEQVKPAPAYSYRELKSIANGNFYFANRFMRFSLNNHYAAYALSYSITDMKNGGAEIKRLPKVLIGSGQNQVDIDLSDAGLIDGGEYLLRVSPFNEQAVQIRFIYRDTMEEPKQ